VQVSRYLQNVRNMEMLCDLNRPLAYWTIKGQFTLQYLFIINLVQQHTIITIIMIMMIIIIMIMTMIIILIITLAQSYVHETSQTPGAAAEAASERRRNKYSSLRQSYLFVPIAAETMEAISKDGMDFLCDLGRRITKNRPNDDLRESAFLLATLCFNSTLQCGRCFGYLHPQNSGGRNVAVPAFVLVLALPGDLYYRGQIINNNRSIIKTVKTQETQTLPPT